MSKYKVRHPEVLLSGWQVGLNGTNFTRVLAGSTSACVPAINASTVGSASVAITNCAANAIFFFTGASVTNASVAPGYFVQSVYGVGSAGASINVANTTSANGNASTMGFWYIGFLRG